MSIVPWTCFDFFFFWLMRSYFIVCLVIFDCVLVTDVKVILLIHILIDQLLFRRGLSLRSPG